VTDVGFLPVKAIAEYVTVNDSEVFLASGDVGASSFKLAEGSEIPVG
jgi:hypothetical protein